MTVRPLDAHSEHLLRELAPQVLGAVIRRFRDFADAEDAVQEALLGAAMQWPQDGLPENPRAWLIQGASRRMTDHLRSELARRRRETAATVHLDHVAPVAGIADEEEQDDTLILLFLCCHEGADSILGYRFDLARGGRIDHGRNSQCVSCPGGDYGTADQPG
jgi:predicted RNA polymerase sigma factor